MSIKSFLPLLLVSIALVSTLVSSAHAARVTQMKGKQVIIDGEGMELVEGEKYFVIVDGKKKAIVVIDRVSKGKAKGTVTKGKAAIDGTVEPTKAMASNAGSSDEEGPEPVPKRKGKKAKREDAGTSTYVGILGGYGMDSQTVTLTGGGSVSMTGSGYSLKAYGDIPFSSSFGLIARGGIEQVNLAGDAPTFKATTSIMYFTGDALLRLSFGDGGFVPFVAGGAGLHFPLSKSSNILDENRIATTFVGYFGAGFNIAMGESMVMNLMGEYAMFPPSNEVSTNYIAARAGLGFRW